MGQYQEVYGTVSMMKVTCKVMCLNGVMAKMN